MTEYRSGAVGEFKREPPPLRVFLSAAELVAITGALTRDLRLPDVDHETIRDLLARLVP